jgi:hypothetical protein
MVDLDKVPAIDDLDEKPEKPALTDLDMKLKQRAVQAGTVGTWLLRNHSVPE